MFIENKAENFSRHLNSYAPSDFFAYLDSGFINECLQQCGVKFRNRVYTPVVTLFSFLSQVLSKDKSAQSAVAELRFARAVKGETICSLNNGAFVKAKKRLSLPFITLVSQKVAAHFSEKVPDGNKAWGHGRVLVVDGTGLSMPDTLSNKKRFPKHRSKREVAFPGLRMLAIFSLSTAAILATKIAPLKGKGTGELSLLYSLWNFFKAKDTLLCDAIFSTYWVIAKCVFSKIDLVAEFRKKSYGRINKKLDDQIIELEKSKKPPHGLSEKEWKSYPAKIKVRIIKLTCAPKGFRVRSKYILTTHLDANLVTASEIRDLYRKRWEAEINLRSIKISLGMDVLRSKSADMIEKEINIFILAYNLIRLKMCEVAKNFKKIPTQLSFTAAQQNLSLERFIGRLGIKLSASQVEELDKGLSLLQIGKRPNRYEPRAVKRRPKNYGAMPPDREKAREKLHKKRKL